MLMTRPYLGFVGSLALVALAGVLPATAQDQTARGTATAVTDVSVTVKTAQQAMTFDVDSKTVVEAEGAGQKAREARAAGATGIKLTSVLQSGQPVLVSYHEVNGRNLATHIRRVLNAGSDGASMARPSAVSAGVVKSVTVSALVVAASGKDTTFAVDQETRVIGTGVGTATAAAGGRIAITSLVSAGDTVQVSYSQAAGAIRATEVRITAKAR